MLFCCSLLVVRSSWGNEFVVRRGRPEGRPAVIFDHSPFHSGTPFGRPLRYSPLEDGGDGGSFMESAVQSQFSVIGFGDVFSDGQAQAGSAGVFGAG